MLKKTEYKVKPETLHYWEIIAAWVWKISPIELFEKSRAGAKAYARFFCLEFMHKRLNLTQETSARRYGKKHDEVVYAIKKNKELSSVDKFYREKYNKFKKPVKNLNNSKALNIKRCRLLTTRTG